ncbi:glycosyltransferase [Aerococcus urinaeequi]|uniref:glycosyltransferase n=1 Tax=Aerococcus urinaeequi TaxID=51665 RepID=UPI003B3B66AD
MKALFAHDHIFYHYNDKYYSTGGLSLEVLQRYTRVFEDLTVLSRQKEMNKIDKKLTISSNDNIEFIKIDNINTFKNLRLYNRVNNTVKKQVSKTDYVIARIPSTIGSLAIKWAKKLKKPYLIEVVGCSWDAYKNHGRLIGKLIAPFAFLKQRFEVKNSLYTIYITKEFLQKRYPTKNRSVVCPNVLIPRVDEEVIYRRKNKIGNMSENREIVFGLIGSLEVDYKGHETAIRALAQIKGEIKKFRIEFLGKGNPEKWQKLAQELGVLDNIHFIGTLSSGEKVFDWLDSLDVQLQPSFAEAQGRSIIEGMSRGCPIVASTVGGIVELIQNDFLVNAGDYQTLAKRILKILDKDRLLNQSEINFYKSKEFYKDNIDEVRNKFLQEFKKGY